MHTHNQLRDCLRYQSRGKLSHDIFALAHYADYLPTKQFQFLFHSLLRVLFIFPSRYLSTIGSSSIFSFTRNLPRTLRQQSQATRLKIQFNKIKYKYYPGLSPALVLLSNRFKYLNPICELNYTAQRTVFNCAYHPELLPLPSPVLRQSLLLSFPPLTNMLTFSG